MSTTHRPFWASLLSDFQHDNRGAVAIIFSLTIITILATIGLAVDVGRALRAGGTVGSAVDAAVLAGAKGLRLQNMTNAQVTAVVTDIFDRNLDNMGGNKPNISNFDVIIDRARGRVELVVDATIPTVLGRLAGINTLAASRRGVAIFEQNDIEVALQLDVTGSMGGSKIADLKLATKDLLDILIPDDLTVLGGQKVRIGFAPYAAGVNAGSYANAINGGVPAPDNCVYERRNDTYQDSDNFPSGSSALKTKLDLPGANNCPSATIQPIIEDKNVLKSAVDSYSAGGSTAGHLGSAFAWYLLSPEWSSVWPIASEPAAYSSGTTTKVAILMTDGEYNTVGGIHSGGNIGPSSDFAKDTCAAMKTKGITIYTVGFKLNAPTAINTLQSCATDSNKFYSAEDGEALRSAFQAIAQDIATLRIAE
jgi:Flp pilus assembly protein TadG